MRSVSICDEGTATKAHKRTEWHHGGIAPAHNVRIRQYRATDRAAVRQLCCDTGFLGDPIEAIFQDRELFADLLTNPYLDYEPEWALIAEHRGQIVGYLLGSVSRSFDRVLMRSGARAAWRMIVNVLTGRYARHPRSRRFVRWVITSGYRERLQHPANAAHLHVDLAEGYRGRGIGRSLWAAYEQRLRAVGVPGCYGEFFSLPGRRPECAYARFGFRVFGRRKTTFFEPDLAAPVELVCVYKRLAPL